MSKILHYVSMPAGRDRIIRDIGMFSIVGGTIVSAILIVATMLR